MKEFRKTIKVVHFVILYVGMLSYKVLSYIYDRNEELTFYMQHTAIWLLSKSILSIIALPIMLAKLSSRLI